MSTDYNNTGSLNPAKDKRSDKSPDWYGKLMVSGEVLEALKQGKQIRISGWERDGKYGQFISLKVSLDQPRERNEEKQSEPQKQAIGGAYDWHTGDMRPRDPSSMATEHRPSSKEDFDDDIPFAFAIAVPALALIMAAVHHAGVLIA